VLPKCILLVDDYPDTLEVWGLYLRSVGYKVITATDGLEALRQAHLYHPDLVVLDLELPGISGFEAASRLKRSPETARIPLIAATGYSHAQQLDHARESGFDSIAIKPCDPTALGAEIERLLSEADTMASHVGAEVPVERLSQNR
jgi:CheY-like chemotaxis protein